MTIGDATTILEVLTKLEELDDRDNVEGAYQFVLNSDGSWEIVTRFDSVIEESGTLP